MCLLWDLGFKLALTLKELEDLNRRPKNVPGHKGGNELTRETKSNEAFSLLLDFISDPIYVGTPQVTSKNRDAQGTDTMRHGIKKK